MNPDLFRIQLRLRPLPDPVQQILAQCLMPPRLTAHLILVHHIACEIVDYLHQFSAYFDGNIVCLGAALHDLGKLEHLEELSGAGAHHEITGPDYLIKLGITQNIARFARTHARWADEPEITLEDVLVALADTCWKGQRNSVLEQAIVEQLSTLSGRDYWKIWLIVDQMVEYCSQNAEEYLIWHAQFSTIPPVHLA